MKSSPLKIFLLILAVVLLLLPLQWLPDITVGSYEVKRVALLSDVLPEPSSGSTATDSAASLPKIKPAFRDTCPSGIVCIEDYADETARGMAPLYEALHHSRTLDRPVRIAYLGDSFIEVDILTSSLRTLLQKKFGGSGVGYVDMAPPYADNRSTVRQRYGGWDTHCVLDKGQYDRNRLNPSGRYFVPKGTHALPPLHRQFTGGHKTGRRPHVRTPHRRNRTSGGTELQGKGRQSAVANSRRNGHHLLGSSRREPSRSHRGQFLPAWM